MKPGMVGDSVSLAVRERPPKSGRPSGKGEVGSPLCRAVRLDEAHQGRGGQRLGGEDASLKLEAEAAEGVAAEHNLRGLCVHDLPAWPHCAGGQRHCGAGGQGTQWG